MYIHTTIHWLHITIYTYVVNRYQNPSISLQDTLRRFETGTASSHSSPGRRRVDTALESGHFESMSPKVCRKHQLRWFWI